MAARLKMYLVKTLRELTAMSTDDLLRERYERFRRIGQFVEADSVDAATNAPPPAGGGVAPA